MDGLEKRVSQNEIVKDLEDSVDFKGLQSKSFAEKKEGDILSMRQRVSTEVVPGRVSGFQKRRNL